MGSSADVLSVSALTLQIKARLESLYPQVKIRGEVSNCKRHSGGHIYLTMKDEGAQIPVVIWKSVAARMGVEVADGMEVVATGRLEVYAPAGRYQLICTSVTGVGEGALQQAFAALLQKLSGEGLFSTALKRQLPRIPESVGLITSPTGAVIRDMGNVLERRFAAARVMLLPVRVQGEGAAREVADALAWFNARPLGDRYRPAVIVVARGGGSLEDLQAFNTEVVARAIVASEIPVISAIGHETDLTISDMVADVRAGTPSIAAELVVPDSRELVRAVELLRERGYGSLVRQVEGAERQVESICGSYAFNRPVIAMEQQTERIGVLMASMARNEERLLVERERHLGSVRQHLELLDFHKTLERGYTLVRRNGAFVTSSRELGIDDRVELVLCDGMVPAVVTGGDGCV